MNYYKFTNLDPQGKPWGVVTIENLWGDLYALKYNRPQNKLNPEDWIKLFSQAKDKALDCGAKRIGIRVRLEYEREVFQKILNLLKFKKIGGRIEYHQSVDKLPTEKGTPFLWKTTDQLSWSEDMIAGFTERITRNTLDVDPNENPMDFIQDWLSHDDLTCGKECISIGFLNNQPISIVIVQIEKKSGWSRISYMGTLPEFRGQGLGKWIHRHGFQKMKDQGGKLYHGGTHVNNTAMRTLFEQHGCQFLCEMEEWEWTSEMDSKHEA